jgi:hypothetical protein
VRIAIGNAAIYDSWNLGDTLVTEKKGGAELTNPAETTNTLLVPKAGSEPARFHNTHSADTSLSSCKYLYSV